jgi:hypothetical protein
LMRKNAEEARRGGRAPAEVLVYAGTFLSSTKRSPG